MDNKVTYKIESLDILKAEQIKAQIKYETYDCYSCGIAILVDVNRTSPRNYCISCAWNKLGAVDELHR